MKEKKQWAVKGLWNHPHWKLPVTIARYAKESGAIKAIKEAKKKPYFTELRIEEE